MNLTRTRLTVVNHLSLLWHQLINRDLRHVDENLHGQGLRLPARADVTVGMVVSYDSGQVVPGCIAEGFLGVVASIVDGKAIIVLAGNATVQLTNPAVTGDFVYVRDDGRCQGLTQADAITGDFNSTRILGTCVSGGDDSCVVAVRARGWIGALSKAPAVSAEAMICRSVPDAVRRPYLISTGVFTMGGLPVVDSAFSDTSNISGVVVTGNAMRFNFTHAYASLPVVDLALKAAQRFVLNRFITTTYAVAKLYDHTGAALNFSAVAGPIHFTAKGAAA